MRPRAIGIHHLALEARHARMPQPDLLPHHSIPRRFRAPDRSPGSQSQAPLVQQRGRPALGGKFRRSHAQGPSAAARPLQARPRRIVLLSICGAVYPHSRGLAQFAGPVGAEGAVLCGAPSLYQRAHASADH